MLDHYFVAGVARETGEFATKIAQAVAGDWLEILGHLPSWAIDKACKRYLSGPNCRRKPIAGEILALANEEMTTVRRSKRFLEVMKLEVISADQQIRLSPEEAEARSKAMSERLQKLSNAIRIERLSKPSKTYIAEPVKPKPTGQITRVDEIGAPSENLLNSPIFQNLKAKEKTDVDGG